MNFTPVQSSNIRGIGYDPETHQMVVQFNSGANYMHYGVSPEAYDAFMGAKSKGSHYHQAIKGVYRTEQVPAEQQQQQ